MNLINLQYSLVAKHRISCLHWLALKRLQDKLEHNTLENKIRTIHFD